MEVGFRPANCKACTAEPPRFKSFPAPSQASRRYLELRALAVGCFRCLRAKDGAAQGGIDQRVGRAQHSELE